MKKKIFSLVLCVMMCASVLTGCNLFTRDLETYYNAVVAEINYQYAIGQETHTYTEKITKRNLLDAYYSYGSTYVDNGYTQKEAINLTLDTLINRNLMITEVERYYADNGEELLNDAEKTYLFEETYEAILDLYEQHYNEIVGEGESTSSSTSSSITPENVFEEYEKKATLYTDANGKVGIKKVDIVKNVKDRNYILKNSDGTAYNLEYKDSEGNYIFKDLIYEDILEYAKSSTNYKSALVDYMNEVRDNYSYLDQKKKKTCFMFELDRVYEILKDNYIVEKYEQIYNGLAKSGSFVTNVKVEDVVRYYENNLVTDYEKYASDYETFESDILSESTMPNYINTSEGSKFFNVAVIKIGFEDGAKDNLDKQLEEGMDIDEYYDKLLNLYSNARVEVRDSKTGEGTGEKIGANALYKEIQTTLSSTKNYKNADEILKNEAQVNAILNDYNVDISSLDASEAQEVKEKTVKAYVERENEVIAREKASAFRDYFYYYNADTTYLNSDKLSVFGISNAGEVLYNTTYASANVADDSMKGYEMYDEFENAIKSLYNNGKAQVGDISGIVRGSDGYYILFYAGEVTNLYSSVNEDFTLTQNDIRTLASTPLNVFTNKTIFDQIYDSLFVDSAFGTYEEENMKLLVHSLTLGDKKGIITHEDKYDDLF